MPVTPQKLHELAGRMAALGIRDADLQEKFTRGSGKGGQKVNKTNNCVCLTHVPSGIVVKCHREREREINRYLARRALCDELDHRLNGAPSAHEMELRRARKRGSSHGRRALSVVTRKERPSPEAEHGE